MYSSMCGTIHVEGVVSVENTTSFSAWEAFLSPVASCVCALVTNEGRYSTDIECRWPHPLEPRTCVTECEVLLGMGQDSRSLSFLSSSMTLPSEPVGQSILTMDSAGPGVRRQKSEAWLPL